MRTRTRTNTRVHAHLLGLALLEEPDAHVDHDHAQDEAHVGPRLECGTHDSRCEQDPDEQPAPRLRRCVVRVWRAWRGEQRGGVESRPPRARASQVRQTGVSRVRHAAALRRCDGLATCAATITPA
jgi:hypothetical protein